MFIKNLLNKLKKNNPDEINKIEPTEQANEESLAEIINDDEIERGLPLNEKTSNKSNVTKVAIAGMGLLAVGAIVTGLISFSSSNSNEDIADTASAASDTVTNVNPKDFDKDKKDIVLSQATAQSDTSAASAELNSESASAPVVGAVDSSANVDSTNSITANSDMQQQSTNPAMTNRIRRLGGEVVLALDNKGSSGLVQAVSGDNNSDSGSFNTDSNGSVLNNKLNPTVTTRTHAIQRGNQSMMLTKGTGIRCTLETRIVTTQPGFTRCQITSDVYSADGKVLLLERGSKIIGEQTAALLQGQARVFVLWNEVETPNGVKVSLASPGAGALGESGHGAKVNYHFWQRFGGAIMISMISDLGDSLSNKSSKGDNNNITYENTNEAAQQMATEALKNSINIPPTGIVNQGSIINVFVARDVDFSNVYDIVKRPFIF
ncbi:type IV secretion system protein VirB10 [Snodgrassella sp. B3088]|uniref:type IV secretion system protein VirB10 n=1 Tax=Snodgrassella sp. B3088 TaxID=2818038 RepID=UPI00226A8E9B|nr:type IV secretion system protein VirB10 [Snodgrassella sp. B3088]MCX8748650.1 type IV secretion system protein VirB10 [Snodgrassella sp. B3088]